MENKKTTLRDKLALDRTRLANTRTLLAFFRTSLYFFIAGLTILNLSIFKDLELLPDLLFIMAFVLIILGIIKYIITNRRIKNLYQ